MHLIVALSCEARPLIKHYGLKRCFEDSAYPLFRNEEMTLTVSGVGKLAAAGAVAYTQGRYGYQQTAMWLNIGVAGQATLETGDCRIAHKITDLETSRHWYPPILFSTPCQTAEIVTVSRPEVDYQLDGLYEMEASGFFATASRFAPLELIHSLKVVSDNRLTPAHRLNQKTISSYIENQLSLIDTLIKAIDDIRQHTIVTSCERYAVFKSNWHFTVQQSNQLSTLLSQWQILSAETLPAVDDVSRMKTSKQVISWLKKQVALLPVRY